MNRADFDTDLPFRVTEYQRLQLAPYLDRVRSDDSIALLALQCVLISQRAEGLLQVFDLIAKVAPTGPIGMDLIRAAVEQAWPGQAWSILAPAMQLNPNSGAPLSMS